MLNEGEPAPKAEGQPAPMATASRIWAHLSRPSLTPLLPQRKEAYESSPDDAEDALLSKMQNGTMEPHEEGFASRLKQIVQLNVGFLYVAVSAVCLCLVNIVVSLFYSRSEEVIPASQVIFVRMFFTGIFTILWSKFISRIPDPILGPPGIRWLLIVRGVTGFFGLSSVYYCLAYLSVSDVTTMTFLAPPVTGIVAVFILGEPYRAIEAVSALASLLGVVFIAQPSALFPSNEAPPIMYDGRPVTESERIHAIWISLVGVLGATGAVISIRKIGSRADPMHTIAYFSYYSCIVAVTLMIIFPSQRPVMPSEWSFVFLMLSIGILGFSAQAFLTIGLQKENAGRATIANYLQLPLSLVLEFVVLGRLPDWLSLLGAIIIVSSALFVVMNKKAPKANAASPVELTQGTATNSTAEYAPLRAEEEQDMV